MAKRWIYRDYRPGKHGQFTTKAKWKRSDNVYREAVYYHGDVEFQKGDAIETLSDLFDVEDYDGDVVEHEVHGTGDTGKKGK